MLNDKDTQDLIKYLTLMKDRFSETVGPENFHRMASLEMRAYDVALRALTAPALKLELPHDVSKEDLENALNECSPDYITSDDKLLGEVKMAMPTTEPHRCNHVWWWNPATMKRICSKCHVKQDAVTGIAMRSNHKLEYNGYNAPCGCYLCGSNKAADEIARGEL